jgi:hypothetical protein
MPALVRHMRSNVVAYLALFVALGGTSYAAATIDGAKLKNRSVAGAKLKKDTLGGGEIKESKLGIVPRSSNADRLGGQGPGAFLRGGQPAGGALKGTYPNPSLSCPAGTKYQSGICFETALRSAAAWATAASTCGVGGRRLATPAELVTIAGRLDTTLSSAGEWSSTAYSDAGPTTIENDATTVVEVAGPTLNVFTSPSAQSAAVDYRCVVPAGNP